MSKIITIKRGVKNEKNFIYKYLYFAKLIRKIKIFKIIISFKKNTKKFISSLFGH